MNSIKAKISIILILLIPFGLSASEKSQKLKPNILWIYLEDVSRWMGCYGDQLASTPNIDRLASLGTRYDRFYTPAGVCSATRSAIVTGMMQTSIGAHQHRSNRSAKIGKYIDRMNLPEGMKTIPEYFRDAGYYTFNDGKDDYNFSWSKAKLYDQYGRMNFQGNEWKDCPKDKPFFGQIQLRGGKDRPKLKDHEKMPLSKVKVPPYYPDIELVRKEIAHHYDCIKWTDHQVGLILKQLEKDDLLDKTYIFLLSDHGYKLHRDKQFLYDGGINMPFIAVGPNLPKNQVSQDLISGIDLGPTSLECADLPIPQHMEGRAIFSDTYQKRNYVISARDRCDYTIEHIRAITTKRYKYLRNFLTDRPYMQPSYKDPWPVSKAFRKMMKEKKMDTVQSLFFGDEKPAEELYDLENDPHEIHNLAKRPEYAKILKEHRSILQKWMHESNDQGQYPESDAALLAALKRWGSRCVNPEYDRVRHLIDEKELNTKVKQGRQKKQN